jgi:hypothetical protein
MTTLISLAVIMAAFVAVFSAGFAIGKDSGAGKTWVNGYVAGLHKADSMWPQVRRWEMTDE